MIQVGSSIRTDDQHLRHANRTQTRTAFLVILTAVDVTTRGTTSSLLMRRRDVLGPGIGRLQVLEKPVESFAIRVVVLPPAEIPDLPPTNRCRPRCMGVLDGVVQAHGKQHRALLAALSL